MVFFFFWSWYPFQGRRRAIYTSFHLLAVFFTCAESPAFLAWRLALRLAWNLLTRREPSLHPSLGRPGMHRGLARRLKLPASTPA